MNLGLNVGGGSLVLPIYASPPMLCLNTEIAVYDICFEKVRRRRGSEREGGEGGGQRGGGGERERHACARVHMPWQDSFAAERILHMTSFQPIRFKIESVLFFKNDPSIPDFEFLDVRPTRSGLGIRQDF